MVYFCSKTSRYMVDTSRRTPEKKIPQREATSVPLSKIRSVCQAYTNIYTQKIIWIIYLYFISYIYIYINNNVIQIYFLRRPAGFALLLANRNENS